MGMGMVGGPQGTNRVEVDGIELPRQRPELLRAQGLSPPQQGHVLRAAEGQGGQQQWGGEEKKGLDPEGPPPSCSLTHPPTHTMVKQRHCESWQLGGLRCG